MDPVVSQPEPTPSNTARADSYYRLDKWYPDISKWTFDTRTMPIAVDEAMMVCDYRQMGQNYLLNEAFGQMEVWEAMDTSNMTQQDIAHRQTQMDHVYDFGPSDYASFDAKAHEYFPAEQLELLKGLEKKIDDLILPYTQRGNGAFIKISTLSPKDSAFYSSRVYEDVNRMISSHPDMDDLLIFLRAITSCMCVRSGAEAMQLLLRSQRATHELHLAELTHKTFEMSLVAREWDPRIKPEWEFRVFVSQGRLTSATQYNNFVFVPEMVDKEAQIRECIMMFWDRIKDDIKCDTYTVDLALTPDLDLESVLVIEINEPPPTAGTSLFEWSDPADRHQVMHGSSFVLRILHAPVPKAMDTIHQPLRRYIDSLRGRAEPNQQREGDGTTIQTPSYGWCVIV
eukprot:TRINITY_DN842_c0_g1_i1.p1 TRINITY_DN842_c0_g1~~TRINITY_DN842_c0_g1_i1.p1  ORF type:complete len:398 (+),score=101.65 TRINITY_DN842_c0_g1_i1:72-1265(+)